MNSQEIESSLKQRFAQDGFITAPFPPRLRSLAMQLIEERISRLARPYTVDSEASIEERAMAIPDAVWSVQMGRAFRIFPDTLSQEICQWADSTIRRQFDKEISAVNVVYPHEPLTNPNISEKHLAIYWRCVRPGKPDAGRPHRDATFWVLEFEEGYDPKIPFAFDYLSDCVKIWIPLYGCTSSTSLQIVAGSHKSSVPTAIEETEYGRRPTISQQWLTENEGLFFSPEPLSQGSCIVFDMNLVHRGPKHNNHQLRISAELCFIMK